MTMLNYRPESSQFLTLIALIFAFFNVLQPVPAAAPAFHPIHICVSEVNFNTTARSLEVTHKLFVDDFEKILEENYKVKLYMNTPKQHPDVDKYIKDYIDKHFKLQINGKSSPVQFVGKEYENEAIWIYAEVPKVTQLSKVHVSSSILLDLYEDQNNFVHVKNGSQKKSLRLRIDETTGEVSF